VARSGLAIALAALLLAPVARAGTAGDAPATPHDIGFVYVEGNVGGASGGHTALRIDDVVYNFQLFPDRVFRLERESWTGFLLRYSTLQNRPIHLASVPVAPATWRQIRDGFAERQLLQHGRLARADTARRDVELVSAWRRPDGTLPLRRAGLVDPGRPGAPAALALRASVEAALGPNHLDDAIERLDTELRKPPNARQLERYRERLAEREALRALREGWALAEPALVDPEREPGVEPQPLSGDERAALARFGRNQQRSIVELLGSSRPDRGEALLLAIARYQVVQRSLDQGRLLFLDPLPDVPPTLDAREVAEQRDELGAVARWLHRIYSDVRPRLLAGDPDESRYSRLEEIAGRWHEARRGASDARPVRLVPGRLAPSRERGLAPPMPEFSPGQLEELAALAHSRERSAMASLATRDAYRLIGRNCVTEIPRTLESLLGGPEALATALGGSPGLGHGAGFIPFVFFDQVTELLPVARLERIAPYRERALVALRERDDSAWLDVRERVTLTASVYEPVDRDGSFLLFTDDVFWRRPLFGALNLGYGLADALVGIPTAPVDRGRRLVRGSFGVLFSLPELAFINIRKGTYDAASLERQALGLDVAGGPDR
jgi:hypothetical protein